MNTPPKPRGPLCLRCLHCRPIPGRSHPRRRLRDPTVWSPKSPPTPQPQGEKGFTCIREIPPALEVCVTRPPAPSPRAPSAGLCLFNCDTLKFPRVPARVSEALVLRTYPLKEADLVVSFLTR